MELGRRQWLGALAGTVAGGVGLGIGTASAQDGALIFEVYDDAKKEFRWRLKAANGQVIGTSGQGYKAKADCEHAIEVIRKGAAKAKRKDLTTK